MFALVKREDLEAALRQVERLVRPPEDMYYRELKESYRRVRTFLPSLLQTVRFGATPAGRPVLEALEFLRSGLPMLKIVEDLVDLQDLVTPIMSPSLSLIHI